MFGELAIVTRILRDHMDNIGNADTPRAYVDRITPLMRAAEAGHVDVVDTLLEFGANAAFGRADKSTMYSPLTYAMFGSADDDEKASMVAALVDYGADLFETACDLVKSCHKDDCAIPTTLFRFLKAEVNLLDCLLQLAHDKKQPHWIAEIEKHLHPLYIDRLFQLAVGLRSMDLPVLVVLTVFEQTVGHHSIVPAVVLWEIAAKVKKSLRFQC